MSENIEEVPVRVEYEITENTPRGYATEMIVQYTQHEFILSFFNIEPPIILGTDEEKVEQLKRIDHLTARGIVRLTISPERMENFLRVLNRHFENYQARLSDPESEE
jgi:hypothetical protein